MQDAVLRIYMLVTIEGTGAGMSGRTTGTRWNVLKRQISAARHITMLMAPRYMPALSSKS